MRQKSRLTGFLMMAAAMVLVGSTIVVSKIISEHIPPFTATAIRFGIACPIFVLLMSLTHQKMPQLSQKEWGILIVQAAAGSVAYTVLLIYGLSFTSGANAGVIVGTLPVIMAILAMAFFGEQPTRPLIIAVFAAGLGVLLITINAENPSTSRPRTEDLMGIGLIVLAVVAEALFLLLNKKIATPISALVLSTLISGIGFILASIPALLEFSSGALDQLPRNALISIVYYAIIPTVLGFLLWYQGSSISTPGEAAFATAMMPVSALLLVSAFLNESITLQQIVGCICVIFAILAGIKKGEI